MKKNAGAESNCVQYNSLASRNYPKRSKAIAAAITAAL